MKLILLVFTVCHVSFSDDIFDKVKRTLATVPGDYTTYQLTRIGNQTFRLETFISSEGDLATASRMLSELEHYPKWVMKNINKKAGGGEYFVKVAGVRPDAQKRRLTIDFEISVSKFSHKSARTFQMMERRLEDRFVIEGRAVLDESSLVDSAFGAMTVFSAPNQKGRIWIYIRGEARLKSALLYTLLPERAAQYEAGARIKTALENYLEWESSR